MTKPISLSALPHSRWACDLDGVLAVKPPLPDKKWTNMSGAERTNYRAATIAWYGIADQLGAPDKHPLIVLSARKETPGIRRITEEWLAVAGLGSCALHLLNVGRTIPNVARFKVGVLHEHDIDAFVEDNMAVLKAMARLRPACSLYHWDGTGPDVPELVYSSIL